MVTNFRHAFSRRHFLKLLISGLGVTQVNSFVSAKALLDLAADSQHLFAAWQIQEKMQIGILQFSSNQTQIKQVLDIPTRAHGLMSLKDGSTIALARRPGEWIVRWFPKTGQAIWHWLPPHRTLNGHGLLSQNQKMLYTTETDLDNGAGFVVLRDVTTFDVLAEWQTFGIDPHQLLFDLDHNLFVANGGVPTAPETGRAKINLAAMDSSIVCLEKNTGKLMNQWRLSDPRLSLRHLAWHGQVLGVSLQAEHDDVNQKKQAPVLAVLRDNKLHLANQPQSLAGYGGDIAASSSGFVVGCPRANGFACFDAQGSWQKLMMLDEACAIANVASRLWIAGVVLAEQYEQNLQPMLQPNAQKIVFHLPNQMRLDNHWVAYPV